MKQNIYHEGKIKEFQNGKLINTYEYTGTNLKPHQIVVEGKDYELQYEVKEDVGTSSGAALVGYMPAGVGAVATNLQRVLHQVSPSYWCGVTHSTA